ncbi:KxYKxGKxW signal peptide domain-containing protein [Limosilactobacillus sp. RRLNB_1_1]|uniref:KxYKxGKxW signal peptide domain-containing protein n=1 Tax=Limosilactobacillus albertensis TaxID=2759752 RepID=A0A7W3Y7D9_9LACO|nr:KxYKxGKxW signal peptide domain-containing protein [Limosilactobacillus albertensis]MBB1068845.1 KxYKxGKxW signal peptide domain-containing protein [Limosilactobacillus albertensis]MCD7118544.1 KxYKxGKxW signal peptide domain-containing protein [Limosilactobacillus albertensis]MCD7127607.1 KxYKxGKxW signal peptide domain-containing protein [Limosilactobacillus albertensis]
MKKKLYKAKKKWVIGIIAGMALLISGGTVTYADSVQGSNMNAPEQNDVANNLAPKSMNTERS